MHATHQHPPISSDMWRSSTTNLIESCWTCLMQPSAVLSLQCSLTSSMQPHVSPLQIPREVATFIQNSGYWA